MQQQNKTQGRNAFDVADGGLEGSNIHQLQKLSCINI